MVDPWFIRQLQEIAREEKAIAASTPDDAAQFRRAKQMGFSDKQLATLWKCTEDKVREMRKAHGILPGCRLVDTCAAEFEAYTPYYYSSYDGEDEVRLTDKERIVILGGSRTVSGRVLSLIIAVCTRLLRSRGDGYETIMVNCNPETVSTDYDTSDSLFFEPLTFEDVIMNIIERIKPKGVIVQFGGQTPLNLAERLEKAGAPVIGTSPDSIARAEDRERFREVVEKLNLLQPANDVATSFEQAEVIAERIGYPVVVRPSFVLGGRAMEIVYDRNALERYMTYAVEASPEHPILIDKFLEAAIEMDVDAISDGETVVVAGIMQHIEEAGVHSGDSACILPP